MVYTSSADILVLDTVVEGHRYGITITGSPAVAVVLEFRNGADPNWRPFPGFTGTAAEVIKNEFFATSPHFRLNFATPPAAPYYVSIVPETLEKF